MEWQTLIAAQPALARIPLRLRALAECREVSAGETMLRIGDPVQSVFSVISGEIRLVRRNRNGSEVVLQRSRGGFFAEASLDSTVYHCDVVAAQKGVVLRFPVKAFRAALDDDANFRNSWMTLLASEVRKLRNQCERLSLHNAAERIFHYLETEGVDGTITLSPPRKAWAAEMGMTHEVLYRTLHKLQADRKIEIQGTRISIVQNTPANLALPR